MKLVKYISILVLCVFAMNANAQNYVMNAFNHYQAQEFDDARIQIDSALTTDAALESQTWQLRGLIYKASDETNAEYLDISITSLAKAKELAPEEEAKVNGYINSTLNAYFNISVHYMDSLMLEKSEAAYKTYKDKYHENLDANKDFTANDVEYYLALGDAYMRKVKSYGGDEKIELSKKAADAYYTVLEIDSLNYDANIGAGIAYYNLGADIVSNMSLTETPLEEIQAGIEMSIEYFNLALPHLKKAHMQNPEDKQIIEGLAGTYLGLQDDENFNIFNNKLKDMEGGNE